MSFTFLVSADLYSQEEMVKKDFSGIEYFELTNNELNDILLEHKMVEAIEVKGDYMYTLPDDKVIFEMRGITSYLFKSKNDFDQYIEKTESPQPIEGMLQTYTHPIKDINFIEKREMYITFFIGQIGTELDLADISDLEKLDNVLNDLSIDELKKYRLSIIALIGEFIVTNLDESEWKYLNIPNPKNEREPVVMIKEQTLINPAIIFYDEYNKKIKNLKHRIDTSKSIRKYLDN